MKARIKPFISSVTGILSPLALRCPGARFVLPFGTWGGNFKRYPGRFKRYLYLLLNLLSNDEHPRRQPE